MNRGKGKRAATSSCPLISNLALEDQEELSGDRLEAEYLKTSTLSPPTKRKIKKRSQVWQHFGEIYVADGIEVTDCNHCKTRVGCGSKKAGTSSLWHHVNNNCSMSSQVNQPTIDQYQTKFSFDASSGTGLGNIKLNKLETKRIRRSLTEFLIEDELPFMLVQKSGFRKYSKILEPRFNMISRHTVSKDCLGVYVDEKDLLKNLFKQLSPRVCLTTDTWTSIQNMVYMCVTAHFIDHQWQLHKRIIEFREVTVHTGLTMSLVLEDILSDWGIEHVLTITMDNASNNNTLVKDLRDRQIQKFGYVAGGIIDYHKNIHMRCATHILNLVVQQGFKDFDRSVLKMRFMVKWVKSSHQLLSENASWKLLC